MLPSGAALAAAGVPQQIAPLLGLVQSQTSALSSSMAQGVGSLTDAVDSAMRSGITSFNNLSSSLSRFGTGLSSTLEGMWKVGSGPGAAGDSADGLAILGGGADLLQQLGGGALSAMQGVGSAASSLFGKGADAVGGVGKKVGGAVGGAVSMGAGVAGAALSVAAPPAAAIMGVVSALGPMIGNLMGGVVDMLFAPLKLVLNGVSAAFSAVTSILGVLGDTALKALGAFGSAVMAATEAALKMAHEIASIRNNTGRSLGDSQRGYWNLRGAGMSGEAASSFIGGAGSAFASKAQTRAWGLPDVTDPEFAEKFARLFQKLEASGPGGYERAKAMADTVSGGHASPALLQMAHQKPETIAREQKWTQGVQKSLGVSPEAIRRFGDEFPLLINRVSTFVETVKVRFGASLLPMMEGVLNALTNYLAANGEQIAGIIQSTIEWLYVEAPVWILKGAHIAVNGIEMIVNGFFMFAEGVAEFLRGIGQGQNGLYSFFEFVASIIDGLIDAGRMLHLTDANTDLAGTLLNWRNSGSPEKMANSIDDGIKTAKGASQSAFGFINGALKTGDQLTGTVEQRRETLQSSLKDINNSVKESGKNTVNAIQEKERDNASSQTLSRLGGYIATDQFLAATR